MNRHVGTLRNDSRAWIEVEADDNGDAMIAAMAAAGVDYIFFTSGSEIGFYQEAVAKAHASVRATAAATSGCSRASTRIRSCGSTPSGTIGWNCRTIRA